MSKCNKIRRLDFNPNYLIKLSLNTALRKGTYPMRLDILKNRNTDLYTKIKSQNLYLVLFFIVVCLNSVRRKN
ncbi:protein of unknown function [Candidatus Nitrosocosmicus franklandus]|uniref:Uncharacterized protein n=1 Tax=Candidatus Nitrosocosmicus franklandianus TaxID=1798806 RepID=A0A484IFR7_9ARCH|nr:protein of unknown function [Candidatus Nitrosocosmicus franklandus]